MDSYRAPSASDEVIESAKQKGFLLTSPFRKARQLIVFSACILGIVGLVEVLALLEIAPQVHASNIVQGGGGTVTHTVGNLTAGFGLIGNGVADIKSADGSGTTYTTQLKGGSAQAGNQFEIHRNSDNFTGFSVSGDSLTTTVYILNAISNISAPTGGINGLTFTTQTNCSSGASPAVCGSSAAGAAVVAAAATTVQVNTTAVTTNSDIIITPQTSSTMGTRLGVTCNSTPLAAYSVSTIVNGVGFVVTAAAPAVNPACFTYSIMN